MFFFEVFLSLFFFSDQPRMQPRVGLTSNSTYQRTVPAKTSSGLPVRYSGHHRPPPPPPPPPPDDGDGS